MFVLCINNTCIYLDVIIYINMITTTIDITEIYIGDIRRNGKSMWLIMKNTFFNTTYII